MKTKTYFASSLPGAIEAARRELGPEAMLVESKLATEAARSYGRLEVIFAWDDNPDTDAAETPSAFLSENKSAHLPRPADRGLDDIRLEISALRDAIGRHGSLIPRRAPEVDAEVVQTLCGYGLEKNIARQIASAAASRTGSATDSLMQEIAAQIPTSSFEPLQAGECRTLAFVGPPGRGKTTSLIKIAVRYGLAAKIPTRIYSVGSHAVGAMEQMARYAAILGVPFQAPATFESLNLALSGDRWQGLVLIDTPGQVTCDREEMDQMSRFFSRKSDIEKHLVIRAEAQTADMEYVLSQFAAVKPTRLLFTGLDEVRGLGAAANTMIQSGIATTFLGTGTRIPDDLEEMSAMKLARSLRTVNNLAAAAA
jgi:flagellar biosynthesis protein FlhF